MRNELILFYFLLDMLLQKLSIELIKPGDIRLTTLYCSVDLRISYLLFCPPWLFSGLLFLLSNVTIIPVLLLNNQEVTIITYVYSNNVKCATYTCKSTAGTYVYFC